MNRNLPEFPPRRIVWQLGWRSGLIQNFFTNIRMQGIGFGWALLPVIKKWSHNKKDIDEKTERHFAYYNGNPYLASIAMAAVARMEAEGDGETTPGLKQRLMATLGVLGDRLFWYNLRPVLLGILVLVISTSSLSLSTVGAILASFIFIFGCITWALRFWGVYYGWRHGDRAAHAMATWPLAKITIPIGTIGALVASLLITAGIIKDNPTPQMPVEPSVALAVLIAAFFGKKMSPYLLYYLVLIIGIIAMCYG